MGKHRFCELHGGEHEPGCGECEVIGELELVDQLLADREQTLALIPECPVHGAGCQPHYRNWIRERL